MSEDESVNDLKQGHKWHDEDTGLMVKKTKKGLRYTVTSTRLPGSATYDLSGRDMRWRNAWRKRILSGYNEKRTEEEE